MKKFVILCIVFFSFFHPAFAQTGTSLQTSVNSLNTLTSVEAVRSDIYTFFATLVGPQVRPSFTSLQLNFRDIKKDTPLYTALQKLVYMDIIKNTKTNLYPQKPLNAFVFYSLVEKIVGKKVMPKEASFVSALKLRNTYTSDIKSLLSQIDDQNEAALALSKDDSDVITQKKDIFFDVYETLKKGHYNRENIPETDLLDGAIEGLATGTKDKFTAYFPPTESKSFQETLNGTYEGIGAYVDMLTPGQVSIISPIVGGPAEKAGIKGGDIIVKVGEKTIEKTTSLSEAVSWIKGLAGTSVTLFILRGTETLSIDVKRESITIKEVEYKVVNGNTFYIQIKSFGDNTFDNFTSALKELKNTSGINKVVIDLRNNPGGYLDVVNSMLGYFVPLGDAVSVVKYHDYKLSNSSAGYEEILAGDYTFVLLENSGTASASEIFIGTFKDYFPSSMIIGETSYGKGSVQTIKPYDDGSSLKYTIAKWYTGKTQTGIDGIGIKPDIEVKITSDDVKNGVDSQLQKALNY